MFVTSGCSDDSCPIEDPRGDLGISIRATAGVVEAVETGGVCAGAKLDCVDAAGAAPFRPGCEIYQLVPKAGGECTLTIRRKGQAPFEQVVQVTHYGT